MKQVGIREVKAQLSVLLKELPFEIIDGKSKKVLAVVERPMVISGFPEPKGGQPLPEKIQVYESKSFLDEPQPKKVVKAVKKAWKAASVSPTPQKVSSWGDVKLCPCGVPKSVCKKHMFDRG